MIFLLLQYLSVRNEKSCYFTSDDRYGVRLLFKRLILELGNSQAPSVSTLIRQEKRFDRDLNFQKLYTDFLNEYEENFE